jgi:hypothetical protein
MTINYDKLNKLSITPSILASNGYKDFRDPLANPSSHLQAWQKCVRNEYGKAYFINFTFSDLTEFYRDRNIDVNPYSWEADMQLETLEEDMTINIKVLSCNKDLNQVEEFCEKMFKKMQFRNYEYYVDGAEDKHKNEIKKQEILENTAILANELPEKTGKTNRNKI